MLQNKYLFNQSSVSLEIYGVPDYSNNEDKDYISIISQWNLNIIDKPPIEGSFDHLKTIMEAFYTYSNSLLNDEVSFYESKLIDIKSDNFFTHNVLLKSSKPNIKPLSFKIGNAVLSDIVNCFDQLRSSDNVKEINLNQSSSINKKSFLSSINSEKIPRLVLPPLISLFSLFIVSAACIFFYDNPNNTNDDTIFDSGKNDTSINKNKR